MLVFLLFLLIMLVFSLETNVNLLQTNPVSQEQMQGSRSVSLYQTNESFRNNHYLNFLL